ncbi:MULTISPECIES: hypothetical protein [Streptomyces]|uniref:hypothetical protein n=1 Tax=Streptomyces TaxID=1883 RepID=UPI00069F1332
MAGGPAPHRHSRRHPPRRQQAPRHPCLAAELRGSRGLVTEAYQRLAETGQVSGRGRGGLVDAVPCRIDLSPGVPDLTAFRRTAWLQAERRMLAALTPQPALREAVVGSLARNRGIRADPGEVVVVAGVAQVLALLAPVLQEEGVHRIAVEEPGLLGVRQQLEYGRLETVRYGWTGPSWSPPRMSSRPERPRQRAPPGDWSSGATTTPSTATTRPRSPRALLPEGSAMPGACPRCSPPPCAWAGCWFRPGCATRWSPPSATPTWAIRS